MKKPSIRTLIVDDHAVVRSGYCGYLQHEGEFDVVAEAADAGEAYSQFKAYRPELIIMDMMLPGASGIEAARRILSADRGARILGFSMHSTPTLVQRALEVGVLGFLTKDSPPDELYLAAREVAEGKRYLSNSLAQAMVFHRVTPSNKLFDTLSPREFEIFAMLLAGECSDEIAQALSLSTKTIANRLTAIRQKLGVTSDIQLVKLAAAAGIGPWSHTDAIN